MIYPTKKPAFMVKSYEIDTKMDYLTFAAILIHRNVFDKIGLLDEVLFFYQEDCEYGLRAKKYNIDFVLCVASKSGEFMPGSPSIEVPWAIRYSTSSRLPPINALIKIL